MLAWNGMNYGFWDELWLDLGHEHKLEWSRVFLDWNDVVIVGLLW